MMPQFGLVCLLQALAFSQCADWETLNPSFTPDGNYLWEGDMILSPYQVSLMYGGDDEVSVRKGVSMPGQLWPNATVPYKFHLSSFGDRDVIKSALQAWMNLTCVKFEEVQGPYEQPHIIFTKKTGCWSDVGRKFWQNGQELSLGYGCTSKLGTIMHEVGHALGFFHEHTRKDRDDYVTIVFENIPKDKQVNFQKVTNSDSRNVTYDYDSIMQYSVEAFSSNGKKTILPKDPTKEFVLGQRDHLSFADLKLIHIMYKCSEKSNCAATSDSCNNGGFVNSDCECVCPPGFTGSKCQTPLETVPKCGGYVKTESNITSPNYPANYPSDSRCIWWVQAPAGKKVQVSFGNFDLRHREDDTLDCYWDHLEVRLKTLHEGESFCGEELKNRSFTTEAEDLVLVFVTKMRSNTGFLAQIKFV